MSLTYERASELLSYDPEEGTLVWKIRRGCRAAGKRAGNVWTGPSGYQRRYVRIDGQVYMEHRVAWLLHHRVWPPCHVDHLDHDATNNRIANLRLAPNNQADNQTHLKLRSNNSSGYTGVSWSKASGKWQAYINVKGSYTHLGLFPTIEEAAAAYAEAKRKYHPFAADYQQEAA